MFQPQIILHPTDFTEFSAYAAHIAVDLARHYKAAIVVLHVAETLGAENVTFGEVATHLEPDDYRARLEGDLRRRGLPVVTDVPVQYLLAEGEAAAEITRVAAERHCDLIVMGTHGRTGLKRLLTGSVAEHVVRLAPCPVLIAKLPQPEAEQKTH